mgnify:FL=1
MTQQEPRRVLVAMSGGVDSSVAAKLLREQGDVCVGCTMKLYHNEDIGLSRGHTCCSLDDVEDARSVAWGLGMDYYVFNLSQDFRDKVMEPFARSYCRGETPNPCIDCNRCLKFARLFDRADDLGCQYVATGHYARIEEQNGRFVLKKALDESKDQSYVLYAMTQAQLARTLFPLGELSKPQVRALAEEGRFGNAHKPDSQDICFAPDGDYASAIGRILGSVPPPGDFVDREGRVLGRHRGIIHYTLGQHRGLGVSLGERQYVLAIRPDKNQVVLGPESALFHREVEVSAVHWISGETLKEPIRLRAKLRYRQREQPALAVPLEDGGVRLLFDEPQRAPTPGQAAVFYDGDVVLGGGVLRRAD